MKLRPRLLPRAAAILVALCLPSVSPLSATSATASVSVAATWDGLLHESTSAVVVSSLESRPVWENGRIYTYTHVHVDRAVAGELGSGADTWIRTMGGIVGKVGQIVEGEAAFAPGESSLLFLRPGPVGAYVVTARGQGQFPVVNDDPSLPLRVVQSHSVGMLLPPRATARAASSSVAAPRLAAEVLHGRPVDDVVKDIAGAWAAAHAR